jgi:luciferase family oxidoreductase group 1
VVMAHVAGGTGTIRIGAGGVMLPNHAPLIIAEQFGTLAALFPGRIDLGLGRAPGSDPSTARALRRNLEAGADGFPNDVLELLNYLAPEQPGQPVRAIPGVGTQVPVWILGSSTYGAQLAAMLGLPYAFASHFAPAELDNALALYRDRFRPSDHLDRPYVMVGAMITAADTDAEAQRLATSMYQAFVNLRNGRAARLPPPVDGYLESLDAGARGMIDHALACAIVGGPQTVKAGLEAFIARTGADEVIAANQVFDHAARLRSFEILARAGGLNPAP